MLTQEASLSRLRSSPSLLEVMHVDVRKVMASTAKEGMHIIMAPTAKILRSDTGAVGLSGALSTGPQKLRATFVPSTNDSMPSTMSSAKPCCDRGLNRSRRPIKGAARGRIT